MSSVPDITQVQQQNKINYSPQAIETTNIHGNVKLENANIKERLNLHVKRRLSGNPQMQLEAQKKPLIKPIPTAETLKTTSGLPESVKPLQKQQRQRRPYTKRKEKSNGLLAGIVNNDGSPTTKINTNNNEGNVAINQRFKRNSAGDHGDCVEDEIQDAEVHNRSSEKDKNVDILNLVLSAKKRALLQDPEVQDVLHKIFNIYNIGWCNPDNS